MSYMTAGKLQAFEALMKEIPGHNHYDSGCDGICPECRSCCFHRPYWKYQTCVFEECPYSPVKLSTLRCQPVMAREGYQKTGKQLMSEDEIAVMDGGKCILQLRGVRPFLSDKYDITKHPKYKMLSDYDKRNAFDIEKYRSHKLVVKPTQTFDLYDMGEVEAD